MKLTIELETALWQISNLALDCHEDKLTGAEYVEKAFEALKQVKNIAYEPVLAVVIDDEEIIKQAYHITSYLDRNCMRSGAREKCIEIAKWMRKTNGQ